MSLALRALSRWREWARLVACAAQRVLGGRARVYVAGGAAEDRLTLLSDVDVVVALKREPGFKEAAAVRARVLEEAERLGLPLHAPVEIHVVGPEGLARYRALVEIECGER